MRFLELIGGLSATTGAPQVLNAFPPQADPEIYGIEYDSRRIAPGFMFVAMRGESTDGNRYIDAAVANGAVAVVTDSGITPREGIAWVRIAPGSGRRALALLSSRFLGEPARKLRLSGITGTNGKTTTSFLLESILNAAGRKTVLVGTIEYHVCGEIFEAPHTTPESLDLQRLFRGGLHRRASEAVMEVSSHALAQERTYGLPFDAAVFTNLTQDHLDYHHDFEQYFAAKRRLFEGVGAPPPRVAVVNVEDEYGAKRLLPFVSGRDRPDLAIEHVFTYGIERGDFHTQSLKIGPDGTTFMMRTLKGEVEIHSPLIGRVNVQNILAASAAAMAGGCVHEQIQEGVARLQRVPGRFERVGGGQPFTVVVDYAHTDDALLNLLRLAREFIGAKGRVITLFGCGGDRDRSKRPRMGRAAGQGSDFVVLTSDNPRSEDPLAIIDEAKKGLETTDAKFTIEPDRRKAIALAISQARAGDIVLLAGKGHEKVQVLAAGTVPFDDVRVAQETLQAAGFAQPARSTA